MREFPTTRAMLETLEPVEPVYCIYPERYRAAAERFLDGFPGRVLYAVKANNVPEVIGGLVASGIGHFDCASLPEIELVRGVAPDAVCYFMTPVRLPGAAAAAQRRFGVRHFMIDDPSGLAPLLDEIDVRESVIFVRMAVSHASAAQDLSSKFGAAPDTVGELLRAVDAAGAEAALAFNVGSGVTSPAAYAYALGIARDVLDASPVRVRLLDIGGGFPLAYPDHDVPPLEDYFAAIRDARATLPLAEHGELLAEPGRALRFKGHKRYTVRAWRGGRPLDGETRPWTVFGPTCDSTDVLPAPLDLPASIDVGDYVEFDAVGAYSLSGRTDFNGFVASTLVRIGADPD